MKRLNLDFVQLPYCFTFYIKMTDTCQTTLLKIYHHKKFKISVLNNTSVASMVIMLLYWQYGKGKVSCTCS